MPIVPALTGPRATPLAGDATAPGLAFVGLRLTDGSLVLELERDGEAARSRLEPASGFSPADGVLAQHDLLAEPRWFVPRPQAARELAVGEPLAGRGLGDGDLLTAVEGLAARRSVRQIAGDIHGADADAVVDRDPDRDVRAQMRRLVKRARFLMKGGYLQFAAGQRPHM